MPSAWKPADLPDAPRAREAVVSGKRQALLKRDHAVRSLADRDAERGVGIRGTVRALAAQPGRMAPTHPTGMSEPEAAATRRRQRRVTPVMEQYIEIKAANPDRRSFYRMGDFYELFFDDAETASRALGIVLTKRGKHHGADIPMCGVPVIRADEYLAPADRARPPRRGLRAARGPGRGEEARLEERGAARRGAAGNARHADRRHPARRQAQTTG